MNTKVLKTINKHFNTLQVNAEIQKTPYQSLIFNLAEGIKSELILHTSGSRLIHLSLLTTMDITVHPDLDLFALTLSPNIAPAQIVSLDQQMVLQLNLFASLKTVVPVIDEAIMRMRHLTGSIFTEVLKLTSGQSDLYSALEATQTHLYSSAGVE